MEINGLEQIHAEAEEIIQAEVTEKFTAEQLNDFFFLLGGLNAAHSIATNLTSAVINQLQRIRDERLYLAAGYPRFADYLDNDELPRSQKQVLRAEGSTYVRGSLRLSMSLAANVFGVTTRKLLAAKGVHIAVEGEELVIENHRVPISDTAAVKELVETVHEVLKVRDEREEKKDKKIEKLTAENEQGRVELETKQRELDALNGEDPMAAAVAYTFSAFNNLIDGLKESDDEARRNSPKLICPRLEISGSVYPTRPASHLTSIQRKVRNFSRRSRR
jgi:NACalpha-BTF3-like transcription factor